MEAGGVAGGEDKVGGAEAGVTAEVQPFEPEDAGVYAALSCGHAACLCWGWLQDLWSNMPCCTLDRGMMDCLCISCICQPCGTLATL